MNYKPWFLTKSGYFIVPSPSTTLKLDTNPVAMIVIYSETAYVPLETVLTFFITFWFFCAEGGDLSSKSR